MAPDVSDIRDSPLAIIGCVLKDRADQVMEIWHSVKAYMNSKYVLFTIIETLRNRTATPRTTPGEK